LRTARHSTAKESPTGSLSYFAISGCRVARRAFMMREGGAQCAFHSS
jgi:hypothetical protein